MEPNIQAWAIETAEDILRRVNAGGDGVGTFASKYSRDLRESLIALKARLDVIGRDTPLESVVESFFTVPWVTCGDSMFFDLGFITPMTDSPRGDSAIAPGLGGLGVADVLVAAAAGAPQPDALRPPGLEASVFELDTWVTVLTNRAQEFARNHDMMCSSARLNSAATAGDMSAQEALSVLLVQGVEVARAWQSEVPFPDELRVCN